MARVLEQNKLEQAQNADELSMPKARKPIAPKHIVEKATRLGISVEDIKLEGNQWTACKGDQCIPLGKAKSSRLETKKNKLIEKSKQVPDRSVLKKQSFRKEGNLENKNTQTIDLRNIKAGDQFIYRHPETEQKMMYEFNNPGNIPGFQVQGLGIFRNNGNDTFRLDKNLNLKSKAEVNNYIKLYPDEAIMVIVTVPSLCPPCRALEARLPKMVQGIRKTGSQLTTIVAEFPDFESGQAVWGEDIRFPTTYIFGAKSKSGKREAERVLGNKAELDQKLHKAARTSR